MPLKNYHLFVGQYDRGLMAPDANHFEIKLNTGEQFYRVAVNVRSQDGSMLMTYVDENFTHELCDRLLIAFPENGIFDINSKDQRKLFGLDFLRRNMVGDFNKMIVLPNNAPGLDNDLEEKLNAVLNKTKATASRIFVFGEQWPSTNAADRYFPEMKDQGIHDIHMNQGNPKNSHDTDNGVFQDGGILVYFPELNRWTAILLAFQSQFNTLNPATLHTDDETGHRIVDGDDGDPGTVSDGTVVIVAALINAKGEESGKEKVIILNTTDEEVSLKGWQLVDRNREVYVIGDVIVAAASGVEVVIPAGSKFTLGNKGGTISLLNKSGIKTSGVQYTKDQAKNEGRLVIF